VPVGVELFPVPQRVHAEHQALLVPFEVAEANAKQARGILGVRGRAYDFEPGRDAPVAFRDLLVAFGRQFVRAGPVHLGERTNAVQADEVGVGVEDDDLEVRLQQEALEHHAHSEGLPGTGLTAQEGVPVETVRPKPRAKPTLHVQRAADLEGRPAACGQIRGYRVFAGPGKVGALEPVFAGRRDPPVGVPPAQDDARAVRVAPL
jgi:hypothetical protein